MNLILVPGNMSYHKEWLDKVEATLSPLFESTRKLSYSHWGTDRELLDFELEYTKLVELANGLNNYIIFAKSAGTLLTMRGSNEKKLNPVKCIFTGIPITWAKNNNFPIINDIVRFSVPTTCIQQEFDITCSVKELNQYLQEFNIKNMTVIEVEGSDHNYDDFDLLKRETEKLIK